MKIGSQIEGEMLTKPRLLVGTIAAAILFAVLATVIYIWRSTGAIDYSLLSTETRAFYQSAAKECKLTSRTNLNIWSDHNVELDRFKCDKGAMSRFQPQARKFAEAAFEEGSGFALSSSEDPSMDIVLFVEKPHFSVSRRALLGDFHSYDFSQVAVGITDGQPSVLLAAENASGDGGAGMDWKLIAALPGGRIGSTTPPDDGIAMRFGKEYLRSGESMGPGVPVFRNGQLMMEYSISEPDDARCCASGGTLQQRYHLASGALTIASIKRLTQAETNRLAQANQPAEAAAPSTTDKQQAAKQVHEVTDGGFWFASSQTRADDYADHEMHVALGDDGNPYYIHDDGTSTLLTELGWLQFNKGHFLIVEVTSNDPWHGKVRLHPTDRTVQIVTALCKAHIPVRTFTDSYNTEEAVLYSSACQPILGEKAAENDLLDH